MADRDKKRPATPWVRTRTVHDVSPWVRLVEREVDFGSGRVERYHAIEQADYVCILAITPEGLIPVVRQYRPALERYTCELPAGMEDPGESAEWRCIRELRSLPASSICKSMWPLSAWPSCVLTRRAFSAEAPGRPSLPSASEGWDRRGAPDGDSEGYNRSPPRVAPTLAGRRPGPRALGPRQALKSCGTNHAASGLPRMARALDQMFA